MLSSLPPLSLYVHLPWCVRKCPYCDFNSYGVGDDAPFDRYVTALVADIEVEAGKAEGRPIESIFLGGGTPSLFDPPRIAKVLNACRQNLSSSTDCEITMEANPGTIERGSMVGYREAGVTRLSIGAQSFDPVMLKVLGRIHGPDEITAAFIEAEKAGFTSINIDLMFALPGQDVNAAAADIEKLLRLSPPHISCYQLTLEPNTVFHQRPPPDMPDDGLAWSIQKHAYATLQDAGYGQYEISAFAKPGHQCRHNLNYWRFGDYLAAGAGAHGKLTTSDGRVCRYRKPANPLRYVESLGQGAESVVADPVSRQDLSFEFMLNALRLADGFSAELFAARTGLDVAVVKKQIDRAVDDGLLEALAPAKWRPSGDGFRFLNDLQARFLPAGDG